MNRNYAEHDSTEVIEINNKKTTFKVYYELPF
jgi:hypothetical protein